MITKLLYHIILSYGTIYLVSHRTGDLSMAFDGIMTAAVTYELNHVLQGGKIEKVYQPEAEELVLNIHSKSGKLKLYMSSSGNHAGMYLSSENFSNPANPSAFCMLLRKHLQSGRITSIKQVGSERIAEIYIETMDELGFNVNKKLVVEIMGKHSNISLVDESSGKIIDSIKRVSIDTSRVRQLLPGMIYQYPPLQDKIPFREVTAGDVASFEGRRLLDCIGGISPSIADELEGNVYENLENIRQRLESGDFMPCVYLKDDSSPMEFSAFPLRAYENNLGKVNFNTVSEATEYYFSHRTSSNRIRQKGNDLLKAVEQKLKKLYLKKQRLAEDLLKAENSEELRLYGELLTANLHRCRTGDRSVTVDNYYNGTTVTIPLDVRYSPSKNAQMYFKKYGKSKTAVREKALQIEENDRDIQYLESVLSYIENADSADTIEALRTELTAEGYLKRRKNSPVQKKQKPSPVEYISSEGFRILVGRNNTENDTLTLKLAGKTDLWLHTKDIPGSHVIVFTEGKEMDEKTIFEAAAIAAYHSKARNSEQVPVDYVPVKYVKKPNGAKPGMVIFTNNRTVYVKPAIPGKA